MKLNDKTRITGDVPDFKQRPLIMERFGADGCTDFIHYTVVLDRAKHAAIYSHADAQKNKGVDIFLRPGPDNLFQALAIFAIELKVSVLSSPD